jgi:hypothetical protein
VGNPVHLRCLCSLIGSGGILFHLSKIANFDECQCVLSPYSHECEVGVVESSRSLMLMCV